MVYEYEQDRLGFLLRAAKTYGPVVQLAPGTVLISGPDEVSQVLRGTNRDFLSMQNFLREKINGNSGSPDLAVWMRSRRAAISGISTEALDKHRLWLADRSYELAGTWQRAGELRELVSDLHGFTSSSIAQFCFADTSGSNVAGAAEQMLDALFPVVASPFQFPTWLRIRPRDFRVRSSLRLLETVVREAFDSATEGLARSLKDADLDPYRSTQILISTLLAAHGVPAAALAWALVELAQHPSIQEEAALSVEGWSPPQPVPTYVQDVVRETLRLWPPSWMLGRETSGEVRCGDWVLPGKCAVMISSWVTHRVAPSWVDPDRFNPGRWNGMTPPNGSYIPYGGGPRFCLGQRFAHVELTMALACLLQRLRFTMASGTARPDARRTLTPRGVLLCATPR